MFKFGARDFWPTMRKSWRRQCLSTQIFSRVPRSVFLPHGVNPGESEIRG
jgi:hypothetical protein